HTAELSGDDGAGDEEGDEPDDPPAEGGRACALDDRGVGDAETDRDEDRDHVERVQNARKHSARDAFGNRLVRFGTRSRHVLPPHEADIERKTAPPAGPPESLVHRAREWSAIPRRWAEKTAPSMR